MNFRIIATDLAIDLGSSSIKVYKKGEGLILNEPSIVVLSQNAKKIMAIGREAKEMLGKTTDELILIRPLEHSLISDFNLTEAMLNYFFQKVNPGFSVIQPRVVIAVPSGITDIQQRAVEDASLHAGARDVIMVDESLAANFGMGLSPEEPKAILTVNIGAGTSEVALVSLNSVVACKTSKKAGDYIDALIIDYLRENKNLEIGENTAEKIKNSLMSLKVKDAQNTMNVEGRSHHDSKPERIILKSGELADLILPFADEVVEMMYRVLEKTPPELAGDIKNYGFVLTGGASMISGLREYIEKKVNLNSSMSEDPMLDPIRGAGLILENPERFMKFK